MRPLVLLLCLALGACAGANATQRGEPLTTGSVRSPLAQAAHASARGNPEWWKEGGVTREKINAMCWMKYEQGRSDMPVERRADLVDVCVKQALKENPIR